MKRTLMMLVAALVMATVASVQAADVKVNLQNRGADQQMVSAQNVKYTIANAEGEIVAEGEKAEIKLDLPEGNYEITVEQKLPNEQVHYGSQQIKVTAEGANVAFEITPNGLQPVEAKPAAISSSTIPRQPNSVPRPYSTTSLPQLPPQTPTNGSMQAGGNWGVLGLIGALVATSVALGVDDDTPDPVSPIQR